MFQWRINWAEKIESVLVVIAGNDICFDMFFSPHSTVSNRMLRKAVPKTLTRIKSTTFLFPISPYSSTHTTYAFIFHKNGNQISLKTFFCRQFVLRVARYPIRDSFFLLLRVSFFLCRTIRTNEVIDPRRYKCDSVTLYGECISMVHMYSQSKSIKFLSSLAYRCRCQRMVTVNGKLREVAERNHQRITVFFLLLFFCMLWRSVWRTVLVERRLFKQKLRISWEPSFER